MNFSVTAPENIIYSIKLEVYRNWFYKWLATTPLKKFAKTKWVDITAYVKTDIIISSTSAPMPPNTKFIIYHE